MWFHHLTRRAVSSWRLPFLNLIIHYWSYISVTRRQQLGLGCRINVGEVMMTLISWGYLGLGAKVYKQSVVLLSTWGVEIFDSESYLIFGESVRERKQPSPLRPMMFWWTSKYGRMLGERFFRFVGERGKSPVRKLESWSVAFAISK